jgi:hypothetical protein
MAFKEKHSRGSFFVDEGWQWPTSNQHTTPLIFDDGERQEFVKSTNHFGFSRSDALCSSKHD